MTPAKNYPDILLDIATGRTRKELHWKNTQVLWSDLVTRLSKTHRTAETHAEYIASKRDRQDEIKDIGGFVGGLLTGGRRKPEAVMHRSVLTLDLDKAPVDFWEDYQLLYDYAACIYSTHKHTPEAPRLRLLIPLNRTVNPCEYEAIGRRLAGRLGIEAFDHTGFQPYRLMYWPSTSADGEYIFKVQEGPLLPVDEVLDTYQDYTDSSQWPVTAKLGARVTREIVKQGDPLEKRGLIGAFCRLYSISAVIEKYLPTVYEPVIDGVGDRYTYVHGSTAGGLVVYDDKYAYSHHGTDPISGKLCNAFDLVRLHLYGSRDEDTSPGPVTKMPSYKAMIQLATMDEAVKVQIGTEKIAAAVREFGEAADPDPKAALFNQVQNVINEVNRSALGLPEVPEPDPGAEVDSDWTKQMDIDGKTNYLATFNNVQLILTHDQFLRGRIALNEFEGAPVVLGALPWQKVNNDYPLGRLFSDRDQADLRGYLETIYGITGAGKVKDALVSVWTRNRFHPVRNYLSGLTWDGVPRLDTVLIDYFGAEDDQYTRAVTRKWFTAAVARVQQPGVKFDYALVLVGQEGIRKSTFYRLMSDPWFTDNFNFHMILNKQAAEQLPGHWIIEIGELTGLKKAEMEGVKSFLSRQEDKQRGAYKEFRGADLRQNVFAGSTNEPAFLRGSTGNRRFWVVQTLVNKVLCAVEDISAVRDQLWAEAMQRYRDGETLYLNDRLEAIAKQVQDAHTETDDRYEALQKYLDTQLPGNWEEMNLYERRGFLAGDELSGKGTVLRETVSAAEIWAECFGGHVREINSQTTKPLHDMMRKMEGWAEQLGGKKRVKNYGLQRYYLRVTAVK